MRLPRPRWPDIRVPKDSEPALPFGKRLLWMAGIWAASILALLAIAMLLRLVLAR